MSREVLRQHGSVRAHEPAGDDLVDAAAVPWPGKRARSSELDDQVREVLEQRADPAARHRFDREIARVEVLRDQVAKPAAATKPAAAPKAKAKPRAAVAATGSGPIKIGPSELDRLRAAKALAIATRQRAEQARALSPAKELKQIELRLDLAIAQGDAYLKGIMPAIRRELEKKQPKPKPKPKLEPKPKPNPDPTPNPDPNPTPTPNPNPNPTPTPDPKSELAVVAKFAEPKPDPKSELAVVAKFAEPAKLAGPPADTNDLAPPATLRDSELSDAIPVRARFVEPADDAPAPRAPQPRGGGRAAAPKPPEPVAIPPELRSGNQAAVNQFVVQQRAKRDAAREQIKDRQLAQCVHASVDANAIALEVKAKNDQKLAALRQDAERKKAAAAQDAAATRHDGPVTVASLTEKLETDVAADKQRLAETLEGKRAELKARLDTQRETLKEQTQKQVANLEAQQKAREGEARQAWLAQQANLRKANEELVAKVRDSVKADQEKLKGQEAQLEEATTRRLAQLESDGKQKAEQIRRDGESKAGAAIAEANRAAAAARANAEDAAAQGLEAKGRQSADAIRAAATVQAKKITDETTKAIEDAKLKGKGQLEAIKTKVDQLNALGEQKLRQADEALKKKLADGEAQLAKQLAGTKEKIEKLRAEGDAKIAKLDADADQKLRTEYERQLAAIDQRAAGTRRALAAGTEKNVQALQRMVDETCKAIDANIAAAEQRMDGHVAAAEQHAQAAVIAQLHRIKAEADAALREVDKWFEQTMKAVDDAVAAAHRQLEETAQGKLLEIEVHIATMFKDTGDSTRHDAVKQQLAWYIEHKQPIPAGFGEVATPEQKKQAGKPDEAKAELASTGAKRDEAKQAEDPEAKRRAELLNPENLSPEGVEAKVAEQLKRGQSETAAAGAASAEDRIQRAYTAASKAMADVAQKETTELGKLEAGDRDAVTAIDKYQRDVAAGEAAADKIAAAAEREDFFGKDPDAGAIMRALEGKTPDEIAAMRKALAAKGIDLDELVESTFSGDDKQEAKIRLQGDPVAADIAALNLNGASKDAKLWFGDLALGYTAVSGQQDRMREILARYKEPKDLAAFAQQFEAQTGRPLSQYLASQGLSADAKALGIPERPRDEGTSEQIKARAADRANQLKADASKGGRQFNAAQADASTANLAEALRGAHFPGTRGDMVRDQLAGKSPEELAYIREKYKAETGRDLDRDMEAALPDAALAESKATLRGDKTQAAVAKILGAEGASFTPWTVDDKKLQDALKELKDPVERRAVLEAYKQRTGTDLADVIAEKMTGNDKDIALAYAEGDALKARMIELDEATNGGWMNSMHRAVEERTGLPTQRLTRALVNSLVSPVGAAVSLFASDDASVVIGGYEIQSGAIHKVDSDKIFEILEETSNPEDRARLKAMYQQRTGRSLDDDMGSKLASHLPGARGDQSNVDAYRALMEGRTHDYRAARMDAALAGMNDPKAFHKLLEGKSASERAAIIEAFNKRHGGSTDAFQQVVANQLSGMDAEKANLLATLPDDPKTGVVKLPDAFVLQYAQDSVWNKLAKAVDSTTGFLDKYPFLYAVPVWGLAAAQVKIWGYFMRGWGVDSGAIKDVLKGKSKAEIAALKQQYPQLEADLTYCLSGRDAFEVGLQLAEGEPQTPEAKIERALALHKFDRGDGAWHSELSNTIVDAFSPSGGMMDRKADALREQLAALRASGGKLSAAQQDELDSSLAMLDASTSNYMAARDEVTGMIASALGAVAGAVVTAFTGGAAAPLLAALASGLMTAGVKAVMLGGAYGRNELGVDMAMMVVQVATAGLSPAPKTFLAQVINGGVGNAISSAVSTAITAQDAHNLLALLTEAGKSGLLGFVSGAAGAAAQTALGNAMEALAPKTFGQKATLAAIFVKGFVTGGAQSVASMLVEGISNPEVLAGNWDAVLKTFLEGGLQNAIGDIGGEFGQRREEARHKAAQALQEATDAAKRVQAEGGSVEDQQHAFAEHLAKDAEHVDGTRGGEAATPLDDGDAAPMNVSEERAAPKRIEDDADHRARAENLLERASEIEDPALAAKVKEIALREAADPHAAGSLETLIDHVTWGYPDADAELHSAIARLEIGRDQDHRSADPVALEAANRKLAAGESLSPAETHALLAGAIDTARRGIVAEFTAGGPERALSAENLGGLCGPAQGRIANELERALLAHGGEVIRIATHADADTAVPGSKLVSGDTAHHLTVVKMPDGQVFLLDPTFGQFMQARTDGGDFGTRMLEHPELARALVRDGFVPLTDDVASAYGRAITNKPDDFTAADFLASNAVEDMRQRAEHADAKISAERAEQARAAYEEHAAPNSAEEREHRARVHERAEQIRAEDPALSPAEAERRARNEILHDIRDAQPGKVAVAAEQLGGAIRAGNGEAAVAAIEAITDLSQRRALLQDLRAQNDGAPLHELLAKLPEEHRARVQAHLDGLRASSEQLAHVQQHLDAAERVRAELAALTRSGADPETLNAAFERAMATRQAAIDAVIDAYGIDDSQVAQRSPTERMGYGLDRGEIVPHLVAIDGEDGWALPTGQVIFPNAGHGLFVDETGQARSPGLVAAIIAHEVEAHIQQLRDERFATGGSDPARDTGSAILEVEAYDHMLRDRERFGLSADECAMLQERRDWYLDVLIAHDPDAHARVLTGDYSVPGHEVEHGELDPRRPWGAEEARDVDEPLPSTQDPEALAAHRSDEKSRRDAMVADASAPIIDIHGNAVHATGLAHPAAIESFVGRMQEVQEKWPALSIEARAKELSAVLNAVLAERGLPPVTLKHADLDESTNGQFVHNKSAIRLNQELLRGESITGPKMAELARTIWHEARHSEQTYLVARHLEREGLDLAQIAALMRRSPQRVRDLLDATMPVTDHQLADGKKYFNSIYNKDASTNDGLYQHRDDVMRRANAGDPDAHALYLRLVEESDAFAVGGAMEAAYRRAHEEADGIPVHESELEEIPDSRRHEVHESELEDMPVARMSAPIVDINGNTVQPTGLADPVAIHSFVGRMSDVEARWSSLDAPARIEALSNAINAELEAKGLPRVRVEGAALGGDHGRHDYSNGAIRINVDLLNGATISRAQMALLTNTVWHEARHAEQWHYIVRYLATRGHTVTEIASLAFMSPHLVHASLADRSMLTPQQFADGKKYCENILGGGRANRDLVMQWRHADPVAREHYVRLVEEADAHAVGYAAEAAYARRQLEADDGFVSHERASAPIVDANGNTVHASGLADRAAIESFVTRMREVESAWPESPQGRIEAITAAINAELAAKGLPPMALRASSFDGRPDDGFYEYQSRTIVLRDSVIEGAMASSAHMARLIEAVWHEARHGEQWHLVVRHLGELGLDAATIALHAGINEAVVRASLADPRPLTEQQRADGKKYFDAIYNPDESTGGSAVAREAVLARMLAGDLDAAAEARRLPEELDADAVGKAAGAEYLAPARDAHAERMAALATAEGYKRAVAEEAARLMAEQPALAPKEAERLARRSVQDEIFDHEAGAIVSAEAVAPRPRVEPQHATGLADPVAVQSFANRMQEIHAGWAAMTVQQRIEAVQRAINAELAAKNLPPVRLGIANLGPLDGHYRDGGILVQQHSFLNRELDAAAMAQLTNTVWHEARHSEQSHLVVRYLAGQGLDAAQIAARLQIREATVRASLADGAPLTAHEHAAAQQYFEHVYDLESHLGVSRRELMRRALAGDRDAQRQSLRLVDELDAAAVGNAAGAAFLAPREESEWIRVRDSELEEIPDSEWQQVHDSELEDVPAPAPHHVTVDRMRELALELARIRNGPAGQIRNESELSNADVVRSMNAQLQSITRDQVDAILARFPVHLQADARTVLAAASGYGNLESLNALRVAMQSHLVAGRQLYAPGSGSLADNVAYLARKESYANVPGADDKRISLTTDLAPRAIVILDAVVLHQLRTDPEFAQRLVDYKCTLIEPHGFTAGINMFNAPSAQAIEQRTGELLARARELHAAAGGAMSFEDAVRATLSEGTTGALAAAHPELVRMLETVDATQHADTSSDTISRQLSGDAGMTETELADALAHLAPEDQNLARELLARQAEILSARRFAIALADMHQSLLTQAGQRGAGPEKVYFYIPETEKSYGMVAMAHREATGTAVDRYVNGRDDLRARQLDPRTVIVILDDVAGSGESLHSAVDDIGSTPFRGHVVGAPMLATEAARDRFHNVLIPTYGKISYEPNAAVHALKQSDFYRNLDPVQRDRLAQLIGHRGWGSNALCTVFPYMAPDNNNRFFADMIAKYFIVNKNRLAAKNRSKNPAQTLPP